MIEIAGIDLRTILAGVMALAAVPYVWRQVGGSGLLRSVLGSLTGGGAVSPATSPADVLQLIERTDCPAARARLCDALNCLLDEGQGSGVRGQESGARTDAQTP